jgi:hypothetical protein
VGTGSGDVRVLYGHPAASALAAFGGRRGVDAKVIECRLCNRPFPRRQLTEHHCRPKQKGGSRDDIELLCAQCHGMVHATFTNQTLAETYPTLGRLRLAPELQPYLRWVRKQPPSRRTRNKPPRRKL